MKHLVLGSRGSKLALWQAEHVAFQLKKVVPQLEIKIKTIKTTGDKLTDVALSRIGDKGVFVKEIEKELINGSIDMAVHSMKDLPSELGWGLKIGAVLKRENPLDVLISRLNLKFTDLPEGAVIGTSSLRRIAQLRSVRSDIRLVNIRGNVETRIRKMHEVKLDGIILAYAGIKRLGLEGLISDLLPRNLILPAVGQGAIAVEVRAKDNSILELIQKINHEKTLLATRAERSFLKVLEGGCQIPVGCYAEVRDESLDIEGIVVSLDGCQVYRSVKTGSKSQPDLIGQELAKELLQKGAAKVLREIREQEN
ncbi:MAG: hydroxymethylbilane synthase [Syntrophomonadaceae bacterium]|jgi:hydroxymethylbilane synthase